MKRGGSGKKKGYFIGQGSGIHIHIVGKNDHLQIGNKRFNFTHQNPDNRMKLAAQALIDYAQGNPGYKECENYFKEYLPVDFFNDSSDSDSDDF